LVFLIVCASIFIGRISDIQLLYLHPDTRGRADSAIRSFAYRKGFVVSDIELRSLTPTEAHVRVRQHLRGRDPVSCWSLYLEDTSSTEIPCAD
jgi:hypothetical protein